MAELDEAIERATKLAKSLRAGNIAHGTDKRLRPAELEVLCEAAQLQVQIERLTDPGIIGIGRAKGPGESGFSVMRWGPDNDDDFDPDFRVTGPTLGTALAAALSEAEGH